MSENLTEYQIKQLFDELHDLRTAMTKGFDELKTLLDTRLETRDRSLKDHETRLQALEKALVRQESMNRILTGIGTTALGAAVTILVRAWLA